MRIAALSDQHGHLPGIPPCDLLIVAGDVCPDRVGQTFAKDDPGSQKAWFEEHARGWLTTSPAAHKILTWGNHDWCGQSCSFESDSPAAAASTTLQILVDEDTRVQPAGVDRPIAIWATPWSNQFMDWAFMQSPADLVRVYAAIPDRVDILVSHQPPHGYGDRPDFLLPGEAEHLGSRELLAAIERVRPRLVICGHMHKGYGRFVHDGIPIYNVAVVDERYRLVRPPTIIDIQDW